MAGDDPAHWAEVRLSVPVETRDAWEALLASLTPECRTAAEACVLEVLVALPKPTLDALLAIAWQRAQRAERAGGALLLQALTANEA